MSSERIFALCVSPARAALHLHRLSGEGTWKALAPRLRNKKGSPPSPVSHQSRHLFFSDANGNTIDDVVVTLFAGSRSFTGEETVEISSHGNPLISALLQKEFLSLGFREAMPGEFTQRAFLNGKLDLAQAEAVRELIHAETHGAIVLARRVTEGTLTEASMQLREHLVSVLATLEAHIDFAEDEVGAFNAAPHLSALKVLEERLSALLASYDVGLRVREGLRVAFLGKPNAGKSSLFNALLRSDRAIVTPIAGTTRDVLEERFQLAHRSFVLTDTAGLRDTCDLVEQKGVERSWKAANNADLICFLADGTRNDEEIGKEFQDLQKHLPDAKWLVIFSKSDLWSAGKTHEQQRFQEFSGCYLKNGDASFCSFSTIAESGCRAVESQLSSSYDQSSSLESLKDAPVLISERQKQSVASARACVQEAIGLLSSGVYLEMVASVLLEANRNLVGIVGDISNDDILGSVFSSFCIGK
jgi:tRNA modification GTPase